ncbi:hypothetical protein GOA86_19055 [Sinorhizobium meliloti]|nr:hypothetical protein [Sinorhizobium meliloti]
MNVASFLMRNPRRKGEDLRDFVLRVILESFEEKNASVRAELVDEALSFYRGRIIDNVEEVAEAKAGSELRRAEAELSELKTKHQALQATHQRLVASYPTSVSVREAEEARLATARVMRAKAAAIAEGPHGIPSNISEAIDKLPDPKPKWSK